MNEEKLFDFMYSIQFCFGTPPPPSNFTEIMTLQQGGLRVARARNL